MERVVLVGVLVVKELVLESVAVLMHPTVRINAMIVGVLLEVVGVVTARVEISGLVQIVVVHVMIHVKPMGVENSVILHAGKTAKVHVVADVLINAVTAKVTVCPVGLVPPIQE